MQVIFRLDDYSAATWCHHETERQLCELFLYLGLPLVVGVTPQMAHAIHDPDNEVFYTLEEDAQRIAMLRQGVTQGWQLALHGYTHQSSSVSAPTEFARVPLAIQSAKIESGRAALESCFPGIPLDVFIPPWNTFDDVTVACAAAQGFRVFCAGDVTPYADRSGIVVLPSWIEVWKLHAYVRQYSLEDLVRIVGNAHLVVTMHEYEFRRDRYTDYVPLAGFADLLREFIARAIAVITFPTDAGPAQFVPRQIRLLEAKLHFMEQANVSPGSVRVDWIHRAARRLARVRSAWLADHGLVTLSLTDKLLDRTRNGLRSGWSA
jgi:predicted deacetylase